jgi:aminopeptidase
MSMNPERYEKIKKYARLASKIGLNVQKNEEVWIDAELDQPEFVTMVVEECYKLGAKHVQVNWSHTPIRKLAVKHETVSELGKVYPYSKAKLKYMVKALPSRLYIISEDPDGMKGINQGKFAKAMRKSRSITKPYRDLMEDKYKWCIIGVPGKAWAKKVFPNLDEEEAINALWDAILATARVDDADPVENWNKHNKFLHDQAEKLEKLDLRKLIYHSKNGTDFEVELIPHCLWGSASEKLRDGRVFNPNIPTEEVFTSPFRGKCNGTLVATKPLSYQGSLIENFSITFKDGKVVEVHARKNQKVLEDMVKMDEGASMLGEVALVPFDSPINNTGLLFYETLYDENAACHVALGAGFAMTLPEAKENELTTEETLERGINDSMIHVDFMVGSKDLSVIGIDKDGNKIQVFKDGNWAI